jgi:hypothetical protein
MARLAFSKAENTESSLFCNVILTGSAAAGARLIGRCSRPGQIPQASTCPAATQLEQFNEAKDIIAAEREEKGKFGRAWFRRHDMKHRGSRSVASNADIR